MAYTADDLTTIERAIATGERRVTFADGRSIEYRDVPDLIEARNLIRTALADDAAAAAGTKRGRFVRMYQSGSGR